jgi:hypothetical protein
MRAGHGVRAKSAPQVFILGALGVPVETTILLIR